MINPSTKNFLQVWLWSVCIVGILAILATVAQAEKLEITFWRSRWVFIVGAFAFSVLISLFLIFSPRLARIAQKIDNLEKSPPRPALAFGSMLFGFFLVWVFRLSIFSETLPQSAPIFWVFLWASLIQLIGVKLIKPSLQLHLGFAIIVLFQGFIYQTIGIFRIVSDDPFSVGYSEAGRFYYASLFFSESLYGTQFPLPFLHPSRYLLLSIPFLISDLPLWAHRFWQAFLWFGLTLIASFALIRRFKFNTWMAVFISAWAFLYFFQGAVYYHLQICVILILAGVSVAHPWRSLFFIILASLWAGISRVNWFPVSAMLAIAIYILETPIANKSWKYWLTPFTWGASGIVFALISQFVYIRISGAPDVSTFASSFTSDLIWKRLLPNETYPLGILPGIMIVSLPLWVGLGQMLKGNMHSLHPFRWLALLAMLVILFIGGAIVSVKIGGGGDLHNMDAYLTLLALISLYFWAKQVPPESEAKANWGKVSWAVLFSAILIPVWFALPKLNVPHSYNATVVKQDIQRINEFVNAASQNGGEVLFITERQLITFHYTDVVLTSHDYEQIELMEMAMSRNRDLLEKFYQDLKERRFALIIAEEQKYSPKKSGAFIEEDQAWVTYVGSPLLCYYKPLEHIQSNNIYFFVPRAKETDCKNPFTD